MSAAVGLRSRLQRLEAQKCGHGVAGFVAPLVDLHGGSHRAADLHAKGYPVVYVARIPGRAPPGPP